MSKPMSHLVLWSGGADSTLLLDDLLRENESHLVTALSVAQHPHLDQGKLVREAAARRKYIKMVDKPFAHGNYKVSMPSTDLNLLIEGTNHQVFWWLLAASTYITSDMKVHLAYIRGDDFWHCVDRVKIMFDALAYGRHLQNVELVFDFEWTEKIDILRRVKERKLPYWTCEMPIKANNRWKACGGCGPCRRDAMFYAQIAKDDKEVVGEGEVKRDAKEECADASM